MKNKKLVVLILLFLCCLQVFLTLFFRRGIFLTPYDRQYWQDRYEHSQYQLPLSQRIIGDDGLYAYTGYRLLKGDDPFSINVDKPPVGKYLIGFSILIFNNPVFSGLIFGLGSIILAFFITKQLLKSITAALIVSLLLLLDPLIISQFWMSLYDIIQLFFLLLNFFFLSQLNNIPRKKLIAKSYLIILAAGISLGIFAEIKPPLILPFLLILESVYLIYKYNLFLSFVYLFGGGLGIFIPYLRYIQLHSFFDFIRIHKYMASFYLQSNLETHHQAIWQVIFLGKFPHITTQQFFSVKEWWLMWPIAILGSSIIFLKKLNFFWKLLIFIIIFSLVSYTLIPAYPRYLILILPFVYLAAVKTFIKFNLKTKKLLFIMIIAYGFINSLSFLLPQPDDALHVFYYSLAKGYFQDIYQENIASNQSLKMTRDEFRSIAQIARQQAEIKVVEIQELSQTVTKWKKEGEAKIRVTYTTRNLGQFIEEKTVKIVKQNGAWKIVWDWNLLLNDFQPGYSIATNILPGKRGSILGNKGIILAEDAFGYLISVNPDKMDTKKEPDMLEAISSVSFQSPIGLQNAYLENALPNSFVPLATNFIPLTNERKQFLESFSGIKLEPYSVRLYYNLDPLGVKNTVYNECCTRIYSATNYHGEKGLEKEFDQLLAGQNGGKTILLNEKGKIVHIIVQSQKQDGQNLLNSNKN